LSEYLARSSRWGVGDPLLSFRGFKGEFEMRQLLLTSMTLGAILGATFEQARADNLVVNGGFETPVVTDFYYDSYTAGQSFTGWTVGQGVVALYTDQYNPGQSDVPYQGNQALQLSSTAPGGNGSLFQSLATTPGVTYDLSFAFASNPFASETVLMNVAWGGGTVANLSATPSHDLQNLGWVVESFLVTATQATTTLEFTNTTPVADAAGPQIDAVSVSAVPEPSSLALIGLGMAGSLGYVGFQKKTRRRSGC
jgi:Protein of unknown function (DUF642)/PEP-CTERM motif